jgi:threonine/homoserine/homoserine lactone efflux protein
VLSHLASFAALVAVLVAIPGPAVVLIMKNAIVYGRRTAMVVAIGVFCGDLVWVAASVVGLTAVLVASRPAFEALRYVGAAYLIYLGCRLLLHGRPAVVSAAEGAPVPGHDTRTGRRAFAQGALCELSNPKTLLVFTSVIPQFVPSDAAAGDLLLFGCLFSALGFASLVAYATVLGSARRVVGESRLSRGLVRAGGAVLAGFGLDLALDPTT